MASCQVLYRCQVCRCRDQVERGGEIGERERERYCNEAASSGWGRSRSRSRYRGPMRGLGVGTGALDRWDVYDRVGRRGLTAGREELRAVWGLWGCLILVKDVGGR